MVKLGEVLPPLYYVIKELENDGTAFDSINWRDKVDSNMRQRQRDDVSALSALIELVGEVLRQIPWDFQIDEPLMPWGTIIIVLVMLHKRVSNDIFALFGCFLFSINPIYVCVAYVSYRLFLNRYSSPKYCAIKSCKFPDYADYKTEKYKDSGMFDTHDMYHYVLIGNDVATLFAAALLSKVGYRCYVLQPQSSSVVSASVPRHSNQIVAIKSAVLGRPLRYLVSMLLLHMHKSDVCFVRD
jgi:hypothetical protein